MTRHHGLSKEATQRLLDLGVEDNLIKLETKIGTKGNKNGIEERAYRLPTHDMLPKERYDWYCFHCHNGGEVVLCIGKALYTKIIILDQFSLKLHALR